MDCRYFKTLIFVLGMSLGLSVQSSSINTSEENSKIWLETNYININNNLKSCEINGIAPKFDQKHPTSYPLNYVNVIIYRFQFRDTKLNWTEKQINEEMEKVKKFYAKQSYGSFTVKWDLSFSVINVNQNKSTFDRDFAKWAKFWRAEVKQKSGIDPENPGTGNVTMMVAPQVGNFNSSAAPPSISLYKHKAWVVAHELGHALGLRHSQALEAGRKIIGNNNPEKEALNYGNVYSMMGMGAEDFDAFNPLYKKFFKGWITDSEIPLIQSSGTYRIYAFDYETKSHGNNIGIRLKSGNGKYTYWVEYRNGSKRYKSLKNGVLLNLEGYFEAFQTDKRYWKTQSYLLDMTPGSKRPGWWAIDQTDSELLIGKSYKDRWGGFKITPKKKGGTDNTPEAWIEVDIEIL